MPETAETQTSMAEPLRKILLQEKATGFKDSTVMGGMDRFLQRWAVDLEPVVGKPPTYSGLTPFQRRRWAGQVMAQLGASSATAKAPAVAKPATAVRARTRSRATPPPIALSLDDPISRLPGVNAGHVPKLKRLGVEKVGDLLYLYPNRHNDFANVRKVADLQVGEEQTVVARVWEARETRPGGRRRSTECILGDETGNIRAVWFNQPYLVRAFRTGAQLVVSGRVYAFRGQKVFESPEYELLEGQEELLHTGRLVPVYPLVDGLYQRTLRRWVKRSLDMGLPQVEEYLPSEVSHRAGLMALRNAISQAHYPDTEADKDSSRRRLAFDELFFMQVAVLSRRRAWQQEGEGIPLEADPRMLEAFLSSLPFTLTAAQERVLKEILDDMGKPKPMSRLLQGEVGSGKTAVAAAALLVAAFAGYQGALAAPTEILAEQHFMTITHLLSGLAQPIKEENQVSVYIDPFPRPISIGLLTGSLSAKARREMHQRIADGTIDIAVGTHALMQEEVGFHSLALAVVDEQQRFGVMQRSSLRQKGGEGNGHRPHLLAMSATPIPRSLALTLYGDLDISVLDQLPPGRQPIRTRWVPSEQRDVAYTFVKKEVASGRQAFIICPLIDESEAIQSRAAVTEHERLSREVFPDLRLGLLHGRLPLKEKEQAMEAFRRGETDVLVSTPVVEVGVDVPNATVMLIDGAERFGMAQLHQFRGRVGRGEHSSYCMLLADTPSEEARERLKVVERLSDGFALAEEDLRLRGPGDYLGTRQSGLPNLRMARLSDQDILATARHEASQLLESDPHLEREEHRLLAQRLREYTGSLGPEIS